jgi:uncharacterized protein (TIGR03086 family)
MLDHLPAAIAEVQTRLNAITPDQWPLPSTCAGWDVRELARHLVGGAQMSTMLLQGATKEEVEAMFASDLLTTDPAADYAAAALFELSEYQKAANLDMVVPHPAMPMPASQMLQFRLTDYVVHAWDLARSTGSDEALNPELVELIWTAIQPMAPMIPHVGVFGTGADGLVGDDAPLQTRLLNLLGRRP